MEINNISGNTSALQMREETARMQSAAMQNVQNMRDNSAVQNRIAENSAVLTDPHSGNHVNTYA